MGKAIAKVVVGAAVVGVSIVGSPVLGAALSSALLSLGAGTVLGGVAQAAGLGPKTARSALTQIDRLHVTMDPTAPRVAVYGTPMMAVDMREAVS